MGLAWRRAGRVGRRNGMASCSSRSAWPLPAAVVETRCQMINSELCATGETSFYVLEKLDCAKCVECP